jgi:magnesium transporter
MPKNKGPKRNTKVGLAPGSLLFTGEQKMDKPQISLILFDQQQLKEEGFDSIKEALRRVQESDKICWLNIDGLHDTSIVEYLVKENRIHKLSGEDILSVGQRPKLDEYDDYIHIVANMLMITDDDIDKEQITLLVYDKLLISFQEKSGDVFQHVRRRLREGSGQIRGRKGDYLGYALVDSIVDQYFVILEHYGIQIEELEEALLNKPTESILANLHLVRRKAIHIRRAIYPMREVVSRFEKSDSTIIENETKLFVRDLYDHTIQVIETVEVFRDSVSGLLDLYMNSISNRMNNVMKVLTIVSTIFIPLTFIAGVYGMNFTNMPELEYKHGYLVTMIVMLIILISMVIFFKKKKWL